jgi:hypothetical protein
MLSVLELVVPWPMPTFGGPKIEMESGDMVKENVVEAVTFPDVPVMVKTVVPNATELLDVRVKETNWLVVLVGLAGLGEKEAVTPVGNPEMERLMGPANPFTELTGTKTAVIVPGPIATFPGF